MLKQIAIGFLLCGQFSLAWADETCVDRGTKLAGAAKTSFLQKCEKDARARCEGEAVVQKYYGAAHSSFVEKCVNDSIGGY